MSLITEDIYGVPSPSTHAGEEDWGVQFNFGWATTDWLSIGIGASVFMEWLGGWGVEGGEQHPPGQLRSAYSFGILLKNRKSTVVFDILSGFSFGRQWLLHAEDLREYLDSGTPFTIGDWVALPLVIEATLTFALQDRRAFLVLRQSNDIFVDQASYSGWLTPGAELWLARWFAVRGALDLSVHKMENVIKYGIGGIGWITFRSTRRGWDLDLGGSYRREPIRSITGEVQYQPAWYVNLTKNLLSKAR